MHIILAMLIGHVCKSKLTTSLMKAYTIMVTLRETIVEKFNGIINNNVTMSHVFPYNVILSFT